MYKLRVVVFIDGSNLFHACRKFEEGFKIDLIKLVGELVGGRDLLRPYFYGSFNPRKEEQTRFYHFLAYNGFTVRTIPLRQRGDKFIEKGIDVVLVIDMLVLGLRRAYDTAILVSGDADYVSAIEEVKRAGGTVEVASFKCVVSEELRRVADGFIPLDDIADRIEIK